MAPNVVFFLFNISTFISLHRTWFGEEKVSLHCGDRAQQRRATGNDEGLPCPKTISFRRLESNKEALWADQTRTKCNTFLGSGAPRAPKAHARGAP